MPPDQTPTRADLDEVARWLEGGLAGRWTVADWQAWAHKAYGWCLTTTRGLIRALARVRELEAEVVLLRAELEQLRRRSAPVAPTVVPPMRRATPPPPPPPPPSAEARALAGRAQRQPTDAEREMRRRAVEAAVAAADDYWREVSSVELEAEVWAPDGETVYEEPG